MATVVYGGSKPGVYLPDNTFCANGKPVEVSDTIADDLIRQGSFTLAPTNDKGNK